MAGRLFGIGVWSKYTTAEQSVEGIKLTAHVDAASSQAIFDTDRVYLIRVTGNKMRVKSPGVIVPMTGQTSTVEFELEKADCAARRLSISPVR
jgi:hypothetical protein